MILMFILSFCVMCFSESDTHINSKPVIYEQSVSYIRMTNRLEDAAALYEKYAPVPRIAIYDFVFGADLKEHKKLNSCGILMISAQCQDEKELPFKDVYFKAGGEIYRLTLLCSKKIENLSPLSARVFGKCRVDSFYLLPYSYTQKEGEILADWAVKLNGFSLAKFPAELSLDFVKKSGSLAPDKKKKIDQEAFKLFASREFSLNASEIEQALAVINKKK